MDRDPVDGVDTRDGGDALQRRERGQAEDDEDDVTVELDGSFLRQVDILAARRGLQAADDYLAQWQWSDEEEREGSARAVAEAVKAELEAKGWPEA
mgnify:CR=1 FL=1